MSITAAHPLTPESIAEQILQDFWDKSLPVDPVKIAVKMGIKVFSSLSLETSGQLLVDESGRKIIKFLRSEPLVRQRFTVAHELGHVCCGHGPRNRTDNSGYSLFNFDPVERDANMFAAALLMPEPAIAHFLDIGASLQGMAAKFCVSERAMQIRLEKLGVV
ncbi:MAG: ImmA/IrrE family metallo-endopeptidase [Desulfovibrio sp.]|jgi:Zn-dependent peptidase ImmA (M78 family)|nr:ImmA/IrrE family metallo-endopeptidase [Desulfovibrio sp.]